MSLAPGTRETDRSTLVCRLWPLESFRLSSRSGSRGIRRTGGASGARYPCFRPNREHYFPDEPNSFPVRPRREYCRNWLQSLVFSGRFLRESAEMREIRCFFPVAGNPAELEARLPGSRVGSKAAPPRILIPRAREGRLLRATAEAPRPAPLPRTRNRAAGAGVWRARRRARSWRPPDRPEIPARRAGGPPWPRR
jgi:hypothetical protein